MMRPLTIAAGLLLAPLLFAAHAQTTAAPATASPATAATTAAPAAASTAAAAKPAAPAEPKATDLTGDAAKGKELTYTCRGCHGVTGYKNAYPSFHVPRIGGQSADLPGLGAHRISRRQAQAPDDAGPGGELLAAGHRRHRRLPFDRERAEVSPTMTIKKNAFAIALLALALTACSGNGEEGHAEGGHAEGEAPKSSSAGLPAGNIEAGMKLATTKRNGPACVDCHGAEGNAPIDKSYPKLGGQYSDYIEHALLAYRKGDRDNRADEPAGEGTHRPADRRPRCVFPFDGKPPGRPARRAVTLRHALKKRPAQAGLFRYADHGVVEAGTCTDVFGGGGAFLMLPLSSCSQGLNGISGGGRAVADCAFLFGSINPQPPPNCRIEITHEIFLSVPGIGIDIDLMPLRTHSCSSVSFGTQYWSNVVGV